MINAGKQTLPRAPCRPGNARKAHCGAQYKVKPAATEMGLDAGAAGRAKTSTATAPSGGHMVVNPCACAWKTRFERIEVQGSKTGICEGES
jgi:hypothetical protein